MTKKYDYYKLTFKCKSEEEKDNLIAILHFISEFESVQEEDNTIIVSYNYDIQPKSLLLSQIELNQLETPYDMEDIENKNWNELYEKSFEPIRLINDSWGIRASFHDPLAVKNEIVIDPKMSFGTGHHETTYQMMEHIDRLTLTQLSVFDYGSGTGILAIMAMKKGAKIVKAIDNEPWAYNNSIENAILNDVEAIQFFLGDISLAEDDHFLIPEKESFDVIIANITKNILIASAHKLFSYSHPSTILLLSGFYESDIEDLMAIYSPLGYKQIHKTHRNQWACLTLTLK